MRAATAAGANGSTCQSMPTFASMFLIASATVWAAVLAVK